nr:hypothetical protein [Tanacetum cinerariifolium]
MVAILEKGEHNTNFHPMVDFLEASPLSYALTVKPTVYVSHLRQFWSTARIETTEGNQDSRNRRRTVPLFAAILVHQGEGSSTPTEPHQTPSPEAQTPSHTTHPSSSLLPITNTSIPTVTPTKTNPIRQYTRRTRIAQSSVPLTVADEPASPQRDVSQGEACPTDSDFIADQDRATIDKSSTLSHDSAPRVTSPAAVEGSMQPTILELMALCTSLQRQLSKLADKFQAQEVKINRLKERVKQLEEREGVAAINSGDNAPIKGRSMDEGEVSTKRVSDDTEEMTNVLTSMDASTVLASGVVDVSTSSGSIPTASTLSKGSVPTGSEEVPTASLVFATATVIARDAEIARIHAEKELQSMIDGLDGNNETVAKYLEEYRQFSSELPMERRIELISDLVKYQDNYTKIYKFQSQQRKSWTKKQKRDYMAMIRNNLGWKVKDFRGMTFEKVEAKFNSVCKQIEDFILMGSKEEAERIKRKEVPEEKVKEMMNLVPIKEVADRMYEPDKEDQLWTYTQNFMHAQVEWKLYDSCGVHHVAAKDKEIFMLVEKDYPLRKGLALVMFCYKLQVENFSQMANELVLKIYKIANSPRQQGD